VQQYPQHLLLTLTPRNQRDILRFYPGQYATIGYKKSLRPSPMRCFSMVSSPNKPAELQFAMRVEGLFTQGVAELQPGDHVQLQGPFGEFVINPDFDKRIVMLAGGIGITPFISMLREAAENRSGTPITLVYGCRSQKDIPFYEELLQLQKVNPNLRVIFVVNDQEITPQAGVTMVPGRVDENRLSQIVGGQPLGISYFICGPNGFRDGLESLLTGWGVSPSRIISESFSQASNTSSFFGMKPSSFTYAAASLAFLGFAGFITTIDLARHLPKATASTVVPAVTTQPTSNTSTDTTSQAPATTDNSSTTNTNSSSYPSSVQTTPTQTYRQPTTSVS